MLIEFSFSGECLLGGRCDNVVSVTKIQWYDEDKCFAAAFSDGVVSLSTKDSYISPIIIDAHQVTTNCDVM